MHKEIKNFPQLSVVLTLRKLIFRGFSGGTVVKNLPANAGDIDLIPAPGRSHMPPSKYPCAILLRSCSRACEPQMWEPACREQCCAMREAAGMRPEPCNRRVAPLIAARESPPAAMKTHAAKNK